MMKFQIFDINYEEVELSHPVYISFKMDCQAVANSLSLKYILKKDAEIKKSFAYENIHYIKIFDSDSSYITDMLVDEVKLSCSQDGITIRIYARSKASLLLDNEAMPQVYKNASLETILKRHAQPFGFEKYIGDNRFFYGTFNVYKGMSNWQVISSFAKEVGYKNPTVNYDNVIDFLNEPNENATVFSNYDTNSSLYYKSEYSFDKSEIISECKLKQDINSGYCVSIKNSYAEEKKVNRIRYINAIDGKYSQNKVNQVITNSNEKSRAIKLFCLGTPKITLNDYALVNDCFFGKVKNLRLSALHYFYDKYEYYTVELYNEF